MEQGGGEFSITVQDIRQLQHEENDGLTLLWVLAGEASLRTGGRQEILRADSLTIVNRNQRWRLESDAGNTTMRVALSGRWVGQLYPDFFAHDYVIPTARCDALRHLLRQLLVVTLINDRHRYRLEAHRWLSEILLLLIDRFQQPALPASRDHHPDLSKRIARVVERIHASYTRRITLAEIAGSEFVSEAWLSRLFRKEMGVSFMQYITALRLEKAAGALRLTRRPLHQIALEQGFASTRMMSDLFRRHHGISPGEYRKAGRHGQDAARPRQDARTQLYPVAVDKLFTLLNEPETRRWESSALTTHPLQERVLELSQLSPVAASLRHAGVVITLRELDDLLRDDVRRQLERLAGALPIQGIDIAEPFLSSRLFAGGWDDPLMAGYACWYNLHQLFSWLAQKGWTVLLHTGLTTRCDLLARFLQQSVNHFTPGITAGWQFVMHWSPQANDETRQQAWQTQRSTLRGWLPQAKLGVWHRFSPTADAAHDEALLGSTIIREADFLACAADANELLDLAQPDPARLS